MYQGQIQTRGLQVYLPQQFLISKISLEAIYGFDPELIDSLGGNYPRCAIVHPEATFFVRYSDLTMENRGTLIVDRAAVVTADAKVLILYRGDFMLAYARVTSTTVVLYDAPSWSLRSSKIGYADDVEIWGVVIS